MKITIDTKEDSHTEIAKLIKMLQHLINHHEYTEQGPSEEATQAFGNMFGETPTVAEPEQEVQEDESSPDIQLY
ncbi:hypothetical protein GOV09_01560 [Candidatus Woesearchaeota archaeon]|nr:hypothetical protein [Candidatus Woesearchaeota archaeon]